MSYILIPIVTRPFSLKDSFRSFVVQWFPWSSIELLDRQVKLLLRNMSKAHFLREVKPQQTIGVLVGASFPGMVGLCEVHL